jgi:hypothetical protein
VDFERQASALQVTQVNDTVDALPPGQARTAVDQVQTSLSSCTDFTTTIDNQPVTFHVSPLSFPRLDDQTLAIYFTAQPQGAVLAGATIAAQFIVIRQGNNLAVLTNVALPTADTALTETLARKQAAKLATL